MCPVFVSRPGGLSFPVFSLHQNQDLQFPSGPSQTLAKADVPSSPYILIHFIGDCRRFFDKNIIIIRELRLHLNNAESLDLIRTDLELNCNFLVWAGLRSAIPASSRGKENDVRLALGFYIITTTLMPL